MNKPSSVAPIFWLVLAVAAVAATFFAYRYFSSGKQSRPAMQAIAVKTQKAHVGTMDVYINALGTVNAPNTATVKSRVDGQLMALHFSEGQIVAKGDLLAEIDPRPFKVQLQQASGQLARDQAALKDAELDLARYRKLIKEQSVSAQKLQAQEGLVGQYRGQVASGRASVADAQLQLTYSRITAPISGVVGLKRVDLGNMVRASDADGIVVITQMQPMQVVFTLVEGNIPAVLEAMKNAVDKDGTLEVQAWGQDNKTLLTTGRLLSLDNQIDTSTGTVKAKAEFDNDEGKLFPNQFVNIRLKVSTLENALLIPTSAVQRNNDGFFAYAVEEGKTRARTITLGHTTDRVSVVQSGLADGDVVVTDGVDRLRDGMPVTYEGQSDAPAPSGEAPRKGKKGAQ